jgi:hypothetical protein
MFNTFGQSDLEQGTLELIIDQLEELVVTVIEEVRARPGVAVAMLAAIGGALVGMMLATRSRRRRGASPARAASRARSLGDAADLMGLGIKLLQNPLVRAYLLSALTGQLKKRMVR